MSFNIDNAAMNTQMYLNTQAPSIFKSDMMHQNAKMNSNAYYVQPPPNMPPNMNMNSKFIRYDNK